MSVRNDDNVQKLIEQIKTDAVDKATEMSEKIIADAKEEAKALSTRQTKRLKKPKKKHKTSLL